VDNTKLRVILELTVIVLILCHFKSSTRVLVLVFVKVVGEHPLFML